MPGLERSRTGFGRWQVQHASHFGKPGSQTPGEQDALGAAHDAAQEAWFHRFLDTLFGDRIRARAAGTAR